MAVDIQWFPGHMAKAIRQFEENISLVDIVFEILDARIPYSSMNPEISRISKGKPHLYIMTKKDLADSNETFKWLTYFRQNKQAAIAIDTKGRFGTNDVIKAIMPILSDKLQREHDKGMKKRPIRAISVGVPNVGKSTILNRLVNRRAAQVGNRPGVTKGQQWLKASSTLELLDTPGVLWPKFQSQEVANKLAFTGAIKESLYHSDDIALFGLEYFRKHAARELKTRYRLSDENLQLSSPDLLMVITKNVGMQADYERASDRFIQDARSGKLGGFTLDDINLVTKNETNN